MRCIARGSGQPCNPSASQASPLPQRGGQELISSCPSNPDGVQVRPSRRKVLPGIDLAEPMIVRTLNCTSQLPATTYVGQAQPVRAWFQSGCHGGVSRASRPAWLTPPWHPVDGDAEPGPCAQSARATKLFHAKPAAPSRTTVTGATGSRSRNSALGSVSGGSHYLDVVRHDRQTA